MPLPAPEEIPLKTNSISRFATAALCAGSLLLFAGCNSTSVVDTWTAPDVSKISFRKIMVVATFPDGVRRRAAEDALKAQITRVECITSYSVLAAESDLKDVAKVSAAAKASGVDGIVVMRPLSDKDKVSYVPGMMSPGPYRTFGGYYNQFYALSPFIYEPGYFTTDRIVKIETNIYEAPGQRLIWSATTTSTNPGDLQQLIKDAASAIRAELVRQKLIAPQS
jgi:hypothetical protein